MSKIKINDFIQISPGFKAAVNLKKDQNDLQKVAGFIPTSVAQDIILDFAKKLHPNTDLRSRIVMGTYGTGKSHLALVLLNFFTKKLNTGAFKSVINKLSPDIKQVLTQYRKQVPKKFLIVNLYGDEGDMSDSLMMGLKKSLIEEGLEQLLPSSAFDAAIDRIKDIEVNFPDHFIILKTQIEKNRMTLDELKTRLNNYEKKAFDIFRKIHPTFSAGGKFSYSSMLSPIEFYNSVAEELISKHKYSGIAVFWDEFGHKMGEIVKDPTGKEGLLLQEFAECCNASSDKQIHLYLFCHRSLKEYHDISLNTLGSSFLQLEEDLRKIEGRFKPFIMKSTDVETFQLIDGVIVSDESSKEWKQITKVCDRYFEDLLDETVSLNYFSGFSPGELKDTVILGTYPLHPMAVYSLPAISEKVAQNNRTLFTCLCEDEPGSFKRFFEKAAFNPSKPFPPMYTIDNLWDYFSNDVKQQSRTSSIYRDFEFLRARLPSKDQLGLRLLKAVSVFKVTNPARIKVNEETLAYSLNIPDKKRKYFAKELARHSDLKNENHILMKLNADGSYRPAVSSATENIIDKIKKIITETPEKLVQSPVQYLKSLWPKLNVNESFEATSYSDSFGVLRELMIEPISISQLQEDLHLLTKDIGDGLYLDGILLVVLCSNSADIKIAQEIATNTLSEKEYRQIVLAIPKEPVLIFHILREHQALNFLKINEAALYGEGGELNEEWNIYDEDRTTQLMDIVSDLFSPEKQMLEYYWQGQFRKVINTRQIKKLTSDLMNTVFPNCPFIGEPKLASDDFGGNWGYRKDCRDLTLKLTNKDAAEKMWTETASSPKHIITQIFKSNGILSKNQAGEFTIDIPDKKAYKGAHKTWKTIEGFIDKSKRAPIPMINIVKALRKPPFGIKCRAMPLFFASVAHSELSLGNISFEYQRSAHKIEKITAIEHTTIENVFTSPDKYKLVYVDVSSNQNALINALIKLYKVDILSSDPALERVKKVGDKIGNWWITLNNHAQITSKISDEAKLLKKHIFKPLSELEPDYQQILLKDSFDFVFDTDEEVKQKAVENLISPIKDEYEKLLDNLKVSIIQQYEEVFKSPDSAEQALKKWFDNLPKAKREYVFNAEPGILMNKCRENSKVDEKALLEIAEDFTGLDISSWSDDLVVKFGAKLDSAIKIIDSFKINDSKTQSSNETDQPSLEESQGVLTVNIDGVQKNRIFDIEGQISPNGVVLENMLNSTIDQLGKGLSENEKMTILYRLISNHVFGENLT